MQGPKTIRFWRNHLPHWQVEAGVYFITIRAAGSLPKADSARIAELHRPMSAVEPASADYLQLQRQYFLTLEKYLDAGYGFSFFWQRDWFDRWMRDEASTAWTKDYIRNNPVKAGLVKKWQEYAWVE